MKLKMYERYTLYDKNQTATNYLWKNLFIVEVIYYNRAYIIEIFKENIIIK